MNPRGSLDEAQDVALKYQNDKIAELALKCGSISIGTLRDFYGSDQDFASLVRGKSVQIVVPNPPL